METKFRQGSPTFGSEKDSSNLHQDVLDEELSQELQLDDLVKVDGFVGKKVHQFYFVKLWPYEDQNLKSRIEEARKLIEKIKQKADLVMENYRLSRLKRDHVVFSHRYLRPRRSAVVRTPAPRSAERMEMDRLLEALDKLRLAKNYAVHTLHKSNNLATEKRLLRRIKKTQESLANDLSFAPAKEFMEFIRWLQRQFNIRDEQILHEIDQLERRKKKSMKDYIRLANKILEEGRMANLEVRAKLIRNFDKKLEAVEKDRDNSIKQCHHLRLRQNQLKGYILQLEKQLDEENSRYERLVSVMNNAREFAIKKDVKALEELSLRELKSG